MGITVVRADTYAAVWAYPRTICKPLCRAMTGQAEPSPRRRHAERAAWGWRHYPGGIVTLINDPSLRIYHLGKSGPYLVRVRGHNTLPADRLVV